MNKSRKETVYILIIAILIVIILAVLFSFRAYYNYSVWESRHNYFNQQNPRIESWMTLEMISSRFNIPFEEIIRELNATEHLNPRVNLDRFCSQYKQDCAIIIERLNNLAGR